MTDDARYLVRYSIIAWTVIDTYLHETICVVEDFEDASAFADYRNLRERRRLALGIL